GLLLASIFITSALSFVNYVPDDMSNALLGLALPLTRSGYFVPSLFTFLGWANPISGALLEMLAVLVGLSSALILLTPRHLGLCAAAVALTLTAAVSAHAWAFKDTAEDRGALGLLRVVWLAPPGEAGWS